MHGKMRNAYKNLIGKSVEKRPLGSCRHRWQKPWNHIKIHVEEIYLWGCSSEYGGRDRKKTLEPSGNIMREEFLHYQGECSSLTKGCSPRNWCQTAGDFSSYTFWELCFGTIFKTYKIFSTRLTLNLRKGIMSGNYGFDSLRCCW